MEKDDPSESSPMKIAEDTTAVSNTRKLDDIIIEDNLNQISNDLKTTVKYVSGYFNVIRYLHGKELEFSEVRYQCKNSLSLISKLMEEKRLKSS